MSPYEILALVALAAAGLAAWRLYRKDTRTRGPDGAPAAPPPSGAPMFSRRPPPSGGRPPDPSP